MKNNSNLKDIIRDKQQELTQIITDKADDYSESIGIKSKIASLQAWATGHPKSFFGYTIGALVVIFALNIFLSISQPPEVHESPANTIPDMTGRFGYLVESTGRELEIRAGLEKLQTYSEFYRLEIDSLRSLPILTAQDSAIIIRDIEYLNRINAILKKNNTSE